MINDNSIREGREYGSSIFSVVNKNGERGFTYTVPNIGDKGSVVVSLAPFGYKTVADIHSHGRSTAGDEKEYWDDEFSGLRGRKQRILSKENRLKVTTGDLGLSNLNKLDSYLVTPNGSLMKYYHKTGDIETISTDMPSDSKSPDRKNSVSSLIGKDESYIKDMLKITFKISGYGY